MNNFRTRPPSQHLWFAYYMFGAIAWFTIGNQMRAHGLSDKELVGGLVLSLVKATVWIGTAALLLKFAIREPLPYSLGLTAGDRPTRPVRAILVGVGFLSLTTGLQIVLGGQPPDWSIPIFPGLALQLVNSVVEEIPFRGFILNRLLSRHVFWRANLFQAALFLFAHWLEWFSHGTRTEIVPMSIALTVFSLALGWVARLSGSVWLAVLIHTLNNFFASRFG